MTLAVEEPLLHRVQDLPTDPPMDSRYVFDALGRAAVTGGNHGLHKYPAKFIPQIPRWGLRYGAFAPGSVVLDPFCGSGTTLVEATLAGHRALGIDINPLGPMVTRAKTSVLDTDLSVIDVVIADTRRLVPERLACLVPGQDSLGLHHTWSNWFSPKNAAGLLAVRDGINNLLLSEELANFLLVCLSSIAKSCSYLDENQIKVRYVASKEPAAPAEAFAAFARRALETQLKLADRLRAQPRAIAETGSATALPFATESVDRVITSPPYINAVDYTMAHKYNLFILGAVAPDRFKDHCREYIGVTERAVRRSDLDNRPSAQHELADLEVAALWGLDTPVARNRAYVVAQYFRGMRGAFAELRRTLRPGGDAIFVIGDNRICGRHLRTADLCAAIAEDEGLRVERRFFHHLANLSSMRLNRSSTGGKVPYETVYVFRRP